MFKLNKIYTSGFVDGIMFLHNGANGAESKMTLCVGSLDPPKSTLSRFRAHECQTDDATPAVAIGRI